MQLQIAIFLHVSHITMKYGEWITRNVFNFHLYFWVNKNNYNDNIKNKNVLFVVKW